MSAEERVLTLLEKAKRKLGINAHIRLILYPMKYKIASISLKTGTIRLNKRIVKILDDELYYILVHELIHLKLASLSHNNTFHKALAEFYEPKMAESIENSLVKKLATLSLHQCIDTYGSESKCL